MILLLIGQDSYRSRQRLHALREGFKKKYDPSGLNVLHLDGTKLTTETFRQSVGQTGFLATKRFVSVDNLISRNKSKKVHEEILGYLDGEWSDENIVVFLEETEGETPRRKKTTRGMGQPLLARLMKEKVEEFPLLTGESLNKWVTTTVRQRGGTISTPAVLELSSLVGSDLWTMSQEINKLISYKEGKSITPDDVRLMVKAAFDGNIFHLTDALAAKDARRSYRLLYDQLESGSHALYLLTMLTRQFRILLQTRELIDHEPNYYTVATRLGIHPFVAQKAIRDARKFSLQELKDTYRQLMEVDIKIKSTAESPRLMFDLLITKICGV